MPAKIQQGFTNRGFARAATTSLLLMCACTSGGCVSSILANKIIRAPNGQKIPKALKPIARNLPKFGSAYYYFETGIKVPSPAATISVGLLEPGDYKLKHELEIDWEKQWLKFNLEAYPRAAADSPISPKATIFLLHGAMMTKESMLHWGFSLAEKGYRAVLVDFRGHGQSTGKTISYGALETSDLIAVLDSLSEKNLIAGRVGVLGLSYGGSIAIDWAARDSRIVSVVALAPFSDAREAIDQFGRATMPNTLAKISPETMRAAFAVAALRGGFDWANTNVVVAAGKLRIPLLLYHGAHDTWIPLSHSEKIKAAAPAGSELRVIPDNHLTISVRLTPISAEVATWFERTLVDQTPRR